MNFTDLGLWLCGTEYPSFLWIFDLSTPPPLLYYSYVPVIVASLFIAFYVFFKDKKSLKSSLLLSVAVFFSLWVVNILVQWVSSYHTILMFAWQMTAILEIGLFLSTIYFARVFLFNKDISFLGKTVLSSIAMATLVAIPTSFNVSAYDVVNCEGTNGLLWDIIYIFEPVVILLVAWWGIQAFRLQKDSAVRTQVVLFTVGVVLFLSAFFFSNYYGELQKEYEFNLWGPIGMVVFLVLLAYMIVRYRTFNVKLFGTQVLVIGIAFLIGSRLFYSTTTEGFILSAATLGAFLISGVFLIRSVRKEIEQREHIEKLAEELQDTNERQEGLIHFIGHEVKGFLTKDSNTFASLLEGDFGVLPAPLRPLVENASVEARRGVDSVATILKAANLKKGTVTYTKEPFDLKALVAEAVEKEKLAAEQKGLTLSFTADDASYQMNGDKAQIADHVLRNLIDNSINYTPTGSIAVSLKRSMDKIVFAVKDTGVGITAEDKAHLFTEGGHGKDSQKVNVHSTGYGLFIAKQITEAHGGTIRADSDGAGQGSTFTVEFPAG